MTYLSDDLYQSVTHAVPIVCVDVIPVRQNAGQWEIGIITRATGPEAGKAALLGGRVWHNETLDDAIKRHILTDWDITNFSFFAGNDIGRPFHVQQHLHQDSSEAPYSFDPTKHAIALTYLIELQETPKPRNEASDFYWVSQESLPLAGYNQQFTMQAAFEFLTNS